MTLGPVISKIRKDKNVPVKNLIYNCMNRSTYTRFVEGKTDVSANKFLILVKRLNLSLNEFDYIYNGYTNSIERYKYELQRIINNPSNYANIVKLSKLRHQLLDKCKIRNRISHNKYFYLYCTTYLVVEYVQFKPLKKQYAEYIKNYLLSRYTWTYYELSLFNMSFFTFNSKTTHVLLKRVISNLIKYQNYPNNKNEAVRTLANVIATCIYRKDVNKATHYYDLTNKIKIFHDQIIEKTILKYYHGLFLIIKGNNKGFKYIKKSLGYLSFVNDQNTYTPMKRFYNKILKLYHIKKVSK